MFRILGSVDTLNEKMGVNLTHHDVNWVYNCQLLKSTSYYLKTRVLEVRLILCFPKTNKGMDQDFLIISGKWHDGLHCPTRDEKPGGVFRFRFPLSIIHTLHLQSLVPFLVICKLVVLYLTESYSNDTFIFGIIEDKHFMTPNLNLVNEPNLTRILQSKIFVHTDGQLRATHIILGYKPISTSFQAPKYIIKVKDPWLHQINVAVPGFLIGPPPAGTQPVEVPIQRVTEEEATSSNPGLEEEATKVVKVVNSS